MRPAMLKVHTQTDKRRYYKQRLISNHFMKTLFYRNLTKIKQRTHVVFLVNLNRMYISVCATTIHMQTEIKSNYFPVCLLLAICCITDNFRGNNFANTTIGTVIGDKELLNF